MLKNKTLLAKKALSENRLNDAKRYIEQSKSRDTTDVSNLLARLARAYRSKQNYESAKQIYRRLITEYPKTIAGQNAMISLGQLELNTFNNNGLALKHFNAYLSSAPFGYLAEEAWVGKARSLSRANSYKEVIKTVDSYLANRPTVSFESEMRLLRANASVHLGNCAIAKKEYHIIISKWPNSKNAQTANTSMERCN